MLVEFEWLPTASSLRFPGCKGRREKWFSPHSSGKSPVFAKLPIVVSGTMPAPVSGRDACGVVKKKIILEVAGWVGQTLGDFQPVRPF